MVENNRKSTQKHGYLDDDNGTPSSMRLMSMVALIGSIAFGIITIFHTVDGKNVNGLYITFAFLLAAFAPKALQKFAEAKFPTSGK